MTIAELFVNIGVKGDGSAKKALGGVKSGLGDIKSMSLEAKAAILGAIYALERMMSSSAKTGTDLLNFSSLTGMSAQSLQEWQYAARQAGVQGEELTSGLKAVQSAMSNMLLGKGAPEGMAMLANTVGFDPAKARDTLYVMGQLQKFAQKVPQDVGNQMLKSFGVSENIISAMRRNAFRPDVLAHAPKYSDSEINQLNKVDVAWSNLGQKIQMAFGHFNSAHGGKLVNDISKITDSVVKLVEALIKLSDALHIFKLLEKVVGVAAAVANEGAADANMFEGIATGKKDTSSKDTWFNKLDALLGGGSEPSTSAIPNVKNVGNDNNKNDITVNQTMNFQHEGKDSKRTGDSVHKATKDAFRQIQAQGQGS